MTAVPSVLERLTDLELGDGRALSVYLDTSSRADQGHHVRLVDMFKDMRRRLPAGERRSFDVAADEVERAINQSPPAGDGIATFASSSGDLLACLPLPGRPRDEVIWDAHPAVGQLQDIVDDHERIAVALIDKERARILSVFVGAIEEQRVVVDHVPPKVRTGGWHLLSQTRFQRRHDDKVARHARHAVAVLTDLLRRRPFDRLLIAGPPEAHTALEHALTRPLRARLAGRLSLEMFAGDQQVLDAADAVGREIQRERELAEVGDLANAESSRHAVVGLTASLDAANEGRIHRLLLSEHFVATGAQCPRCGWLAPSQVPCLACGGPTNEVADVGECLLHRAHSQGARAEVVSGDAAKLLDEYGGVGAWTRYAAAIPSERMAHVA
jgi:hypothetical protein